MVGKEELFVREAWFSFDFLCVTVSILSYRARVPDVRFSSWYARSGCGTSFPSWRQAHACVRVQG